MTVRAHIERPNPPWQDERMTECGRPAAEVVEVWSRDKVRDHIAREGHTRTAYATCMTCLQTSERHQDWAHSPAAVLFRQYWTNTERPLPLDDELRALALLWENHREEYDEELAVIRGAVQLDTAREARRRR